MQIKADLHIHSVLSGCAEEDNTISNIVNMSHLLDTQIIALADHNAIENYPALEAYARQYGIVTIPAMEVTTSEEIHVLCLFRTYKQGLDLFKRIYQQIPKYPLNTSFYNKQLVLDKDDNVVKQYDDLLNVATCYDIFELVDEVSKLGGVAIPAHIDRDSFSVLSVLGSLPPDLNVTTLEVSSVCPASLIEQYRGKYNIICDSDAHNIEALVRFSSYIELDSLSKTNLINMLSVRPNKL
ncbi:MAG: phosphoesterase [Clostridia bacterium]